MSDDLMGQLVQACRERLVAEEQARERLRAGITARDGALWQLYAARGRRDLEGLIEEVHGALREHFTDDEIRRLGLSRGTIRNAVERPRPPE